MGKRWTEQEIEYLKENYSDKFNIDLANELRLTSNQIRRMAFELELKKSKEFWENEKIRISNRMILSNPMKRPEVAKKSRNTLIKRYENGEITNPMKGKNNLSTTKRNLENNPMKNLDNINKNRQSQLENYKNGRKTWCDGLTGEEFLKHFKEGKIWNTGLTKETDDRIREYSEKLAGRKFGEDFTEKIISTHWTNKPKEERDIIIQNMLSHRDYSFIIPKLRLAVQKAWDDPNSTFNSPEYRKKLSIATSMENNPRWIGGKSFEPYGVDFNLKLKNEVRKRDNQVCQNCGIHREKIKRAFDCHHVNYDKNCNIIQNLISLCNKCHTMTNTNREYWQKLFQEKLLKLYNYKYSETGEIILEINNEK